MVSSLVVVGDVFVEILKGTPRVEVVPEIVELLDVLFRAVVITDHGDRRFLAESAFALEDSVPFLVERGWFCDIFLCWGCNICLFIHRVELASLNGVRQDFVGTLNTLEEGIILVALAGGSLLVRMMLQDLLAVCLFDLLVGGLESVF